MATTNSCGQPDLCDLLADDWGPKQEVECYFKDTQPDHFNGLLSCRLASRCCAGPEEDATDYG